MTQKALILGPKREQTTRAMELLSSAAKYALGLSSSRKCMLSSSCLSYNHRLSSSLTPPPLHQYRLLSSSSTSKGFDEEMRAVVDKNLKGRGIHVHAGSSLAELVITDSGIKVGTDHNEELMADVLFTVGPSPNTKRLNLEVVGVELDKSGATKVDEFSQTTVPSIWTIDDVTNRMNLTRMALMEGTLFAKIVFGGQPSKPDYSHIPCAVFSIHLFLWSD